jgi:anti-sigma regulatory factor (Ser/Thr protein kinase)
MSGLTARLDLPLGDHAPRAARAAVHAVLTAWGHADVDWLDTAALVTSELVTNAVLHGGGCLGLNVDSHDGRVTISVSDGSAVVPERRPPDARGGRGLAIIESISARWGVHDHEGGKRVWVELAPCPEPGCDPDTGSTR